MPRDNKLYFERARDHALQVGASGRVEMSGGWYGAGMASGSRTSCGPKRSPSSIAERLTMKKINRMIRGHGVAGFNRRLNYPALDQA